MKPNFRESLRAVAVRHHAGATGIQTALALTRILDDAIRQTYDSLSLSSKNAISLVALGGYGRKELCFASDTDIMFLLPETDPGNKATLAVQKLLHLLLDLGLDIGHSARTTGDCLALRKADVESWVSLVESRLICGNAKLFRNFRRKLEQQIKGGNNGDLVRELSTRTELRHRKYGNSAKLLEPNIKNSAGGIRDLHAVYWLFLASGLKNLPASLPSNATALTTFLASPPLRKYVTAGQLRSVRSGLDFLLRTRNEMHLHAKGLHDSLEFTSQRSIARGLGYASVPNRSSVDRFMQDYYVASRRIAQFARRAASAVRRAYSGKREPQKQVALDDSFILRQQEILPRKPAAGEQNEFLLRACLHALEHSAAFSDELEDWIIRNARTFTVLRAGKDSTLFRAFLNKEGGVGTILHQLSEYGVLERWIPEWKPMVAFFQHNQYHYYTADEHTLRVIQNAEALRNTAGSFADAYRSLPRKDILVLTCLLHDIAKPKRVGDHEVAGASTAVKVLKRLSYNDIADDVGFLVRHHLLMEQTAFRRNLSDAQTIISFAGQFRSPVLLDYLYVLTFADLSAVNKNVWSDWKGMLLFELYQKCREILEGKLTGDEVRTAVQSRHEAAMKELVETLAGAVPGKSSRAHLNAVDSPAYLEAFDAAEIAEHIRHIEREMPVSTIFKHLPDFTEITIIAKDAPSILSKFCGVLSANDANIFDAHVFTRNDGIVIDKFRVIDFISRSVLSQQQCEKIRRELNDVLAGSVGIDNLMERHRMKWRRLSRLQDPQSRGAVKFEDHPRFTIIDVFAPDRLGFLYKITDAISRLNLDISFAKIATRADGIVDSFYVLERSGEKISSKKRKEKVRTSLLGEIQTVIDSELVQNQ